MQTLDLTDIGADMSGDKLKLYIETTVFNFCFDDDREGHDDVVELFERIKAGEFEAYTSDFTTEELERAQEPKKSRMKALVNLEVLNDEEHV